MAVRDIMPSEKRNFPQAQGHALGGEKGERGKGTVQNRYTYAYIDIGVCVSGTKAQRETGAKIG